MLSKIRSKSEFSRNVLTLMTGTTVAQAIPIAISPILTRIYSPEDFGLLALFVAITAILGSIATARYELAIMLPEADDDAINVAALGVVISAAISLLLFLPAFFLNEKISAILENEQIGFWLYFVPVVVFLLGMFNVLNYLNTRKKLYKDIAKANVMKSVGLASAQLSIGFVKAGATGLISGQIIAHFVANYRLTVNALKNYDIGKVNVGEIKKVAKRYINFPKFSMWAILANSLAYNLTNILISLYYSVATLGFYSFAQKMLGMPSSLIGRSIGQVYFQQAVAEKQKTGKAVHTFAKTSKKLFLFSAVIFIPMYFILPLAFEVIFGSEWRTSGEFAQITLPFVAMQFIAAALSNTNNVFEKQKIALVWQVGLSVLSIGSIFVAQFLDWSFVEFIQVFTGCLASYYILLYFILWKVSKGEL